jgi:hypothetical protein
VVVRELGDAEPVAGDGLAVALGEGDAGVDAGVAGLFVVLDLHVVRAGVEGDGGGAGAQAVVAPVVDEALAVDEGTRAVVARERELDRGARGELEARVPAHGEAVARAALRER